MEQDVVVDPPWWKNLLAEGAELTGMSGIVVDFLAVGALLFLALLFHATVGQAVRAGLARFTRSTKATWDDVFIDHKVFSKASMLVPAGVVFFGVKALFGLQPTLAVLIERSAAVAAIFFGARAVDATFDAFLSLYNRSPDSKARPIKGYLQVARMVVWCAAIIVSIAAAIDKSPLIFLSGLGAMTAVLLLVFKDTILGLVASVQLAGNDMLRVGDWIEMPSQNADGDVVDIALHTVKVQNWDNTITTVPTWNLISTGFKNWRGMQESGGRRIKRSLTVEHSSIRHLTNAEIEELRGVSLLTSYLDNAKGKLAEANNAVPGEAQRVATNLRRLTNIGTFRAYLQAWLEAHPGFHKKMTCMVRQLAPTPEGLPIEIYCFTATTTWTVYEGLQADLFDHALAVAGEFGLRIFQAPSSDDVRHLRDLGLTNSGAEKLDLDGRP